MHMAAIYARVSSAQQREEHTIASQTAALIEFARTRALEVPKAWIFEDEGFSGATLERPGLERVRDLAAEGQIQAVLVYAPDRLSRKYAYQILLIEEFARQGVETLFVKAPQSATAEDQLLVQFQGMIAEYERAQILERSRRGKRHRARAGEISVLSGAPYGYRYIRKSDEAPASYAVIEAEERVVRHVYELYTVTGLSIGAVTRWLNDQGVATRKPGARWERSTVWAMLRNPAYRGGACFGKTRVATRQRVTRRLRLRGGISSRNSANHERPREEWIEIPVPALVAEETFARAQELLHENKVRARRRTIEPSLVQGLVSCRRCGYALSRTSTRSSARKIHYYRCIGSDAWRHLGGPVCDNRPVRQDLLDQIVWTEVIRLLEDPALIEQELDRRLAAARAADPTKQREQTLERELLRLGKSIERLLTAYQEELLSLEQLRERMPQLRQREQALRTERQSVAEQTRERAAYLRLAETLSAFLARLRVAADTLDISERQRIVRLVIKEVLVGDDTIVIRHCIPVPSGPPPGGGPSPVGRSNDLGDARNYLLRSGSDSTNAAQHPSLHPSRWSGTTVSVPLVQNENPPRSSATAPAPARTLLVVPTYNEKDNVAPLLREIEALGLRWDILFVDDNSPDGTGRRLDEIARTDPHIRVLHRPGKLGVGSAHLAGIRFAYREGYERLLTMDCDFTHRPAYLLDLVAASEGADIVLGSRYMQRGSLSGWNPLRKLLTYTGHLLTRSLLGLPFDATGALRLYDLRTIPGYVFDLISSSGYSFFFESLFILHRNGMRVREIPILLPPRTYGHSKMSHREVWNSVRLLLSIRLNAWFNRELLVAVPPLQPERLDPRLHEDQGWEAYWRSDSGSGRILYNVIAAFYRKVIIRPALNRFVRRHFPRGGRVLHAGCGGGQVDVDVRRYVNVTALDISTAALEAYRRVNGADADVVHGSIFEVPLPGESVDGIYNLGVMEHFTEHEIARILVELRRLLRKDARLLLFWPPEFGLSVLFFKGLKAVLTSVFRRRDVKFHPDEITRLRSRAHGERLLGDAGLDVVEYSFGPRDLFTYVVLVAKRRPEA